MTTNYEIRLASTREARRIAHMSRDLIEAGLGWSWTESRVIKSIRDRDTNVAVTLDGTTVIGFAITKYRLDEAHIVLLAVDRRHRRRGVGTALINWIEETALTAGIGIVYLETRFVNDRAREFYRVLGFKEFMIEPRRYSGIEAGVRLGKDLWVRSWDYGDS